MSSEPKTFCACPGFFHSIPCIAHPTTSSEFVIVASKIVVKYQLLSAEVETTLEHKVIPAETTARKATTALGRLTGLDIENPSDAVQILTERSARAKRAEAAFTPRDEARIAELMRIMHPLLTELTELKKKKQAATRAPFVNQSSVTRLATIQKDNGAEFTKLVGEWKISKTALNETTVLLTDLRNKLTDMEDTFDRNLINKFTNAKETFQNAVHQENLRTRFIVNGKVANSEDIHRETGMRPSSLDNSEDEFQSMKRKAQVDVVAIATELAKRVKHI